MFGDASFNQRVDVHGDASFNGYLDVSGLVVRTVASHIIPNDDDIYDLGSVDKKFRNLYLGEESLWLGEDNKISIKDGKMKMRKRKKSKVPKSILDAGGTAEEAKSTSGKAARTSSVG